MTGWRFPLNNDGREDGLNNAGIETFQGAPTSSLAREVIQNSLDAAQDSSRDPVKVEFSYHDFKRSEFPDKDKFIRALKSCRDYWDNIEKTKKFFESSLEVMAREEIPILKISDYNTTGLTGAEEDTTNNWFNLIKGDGVSNKQAGAGGSFGIGKQAPFACSNLRTVFYGTKDIEGVEAFQGVAELVTHANIDGGKTQGKGYFGIKDGNRPILDLTDINGYFQREEVGTDIYIFGFKYKKSWEESIIKSVLEHFFAAVYYDDLIVEVEDVVIDSDSIAELLDRYIVSDGSSDYLADRYFDALTADDKHIFIEENFEELGSLELHLVSRKGYPKRVAMIRETGMKIFDKGHIRTTMKFAGVMMAKGKDLNEFLRKLEPPNHDDWQPKRHPDPDYAEKARGKLYSWINDKVKSITIDEEAERLDVDGMSQFLPDEVDEFSLGDEEAEEKEEGMREEAKPLEIKEVKVTKTTADTAEGSAGTPSDKGEIGSVEGEGEGEGEGRGGRYNEETAEEGEGNGRTGDDGDKLSVIERPLRLKKTRIFSLNTEQGIYYASVYPNRSGEGYLKFNIAGEDGRDPAVVKLAKLKNDGETDEDINLSAGRKVGPINFEEGKPCELIFHLENRMRCALEVNADEN